MSDDSQHDELTTLEKKVYRYVYFFDSWSLFVCICYIKNLDDKQQRLDRHG
jgi:hypothetical protein